MFTTEAIVIGAIAALVVGFSKTAIPGAGLLAVPLVASIVEGRLIAGASLPLLLVADVFAVSWYRRHTRWELLRPLAIWVAVGFGFGIAFFIAVGNDLHLIDIAIGVIILVMVVIQVWRMIRRRPPQPARPRDAVVYGSAGGFTTFVSNSAGPVMNTYLVGLGLDKDEQVGVVLLLGQPRQDPALRRARLSDDGRALLHSRGSALERVHDPGDRRRCLRRALDAAAHLAGGVRHHRARALCTWWHPPAALTHSAA